MSNDIVKDFQINQEALPIPQKKQQFTAQIHLVRGFVENFESAQSKMKEMILQSEMIPSVVKVKRNKKKYYQDESIERLNKQSQLQVQIGLKFATLIKKINLDLNQQQEMTSESIILNNTSVFQKVDTIQELNLKFAQGTLVEKMILLKSFQRDVPKALQNMNIIALTLNKYKILKKGSRKLFIIKAQKKIVVVEEEQPTVQYYYKNPKFMSKYGDLDILYPYQIGTQLKLNDIQFNQDFPRPYLSSLLKTLDISWIFSNKV